MINRVQKLGMVWKIERKLAKLLLTTFTYCSPFYLFHASYSCIYLFFVDSITYYFNNHSVDVSRLYSRIISISTLRTTLFPFLGIAQPQSQFPHSCALSDLYIPRIGPHIFLQQKRQIDRGIICILCRWFRFAQLAKGKKFRP